MEWKFVVVGVLISAVLTLVLAVVFLPLFFLGPVIGGVFAAYLDRGDNQAGAVEGAVSGVIGGLIMGALFLLGFGTISAIIGVIFTNAGAAAGTISVFLGAFITLLAVVIREFWARSAEWWVLASGKSVKLFIYYF